jgi:hypothetical protein
MLEREKPQLRQSRGFRVSVDAENAALFMKFIQD